MASFPTNILVEGFKQSIIQCNFLYLKIGLGVHGCLAESCTLLALHLESRAPKAKQLLQLHDPQIKYACARKMVSPNLCPFATLLEPFDQDNLLQVWDIGVGLLSTHASNLCHGQGGKSKLTKCKNQPPHTGLTNRVSIHARWRRAISAPKAEG